MSRAGERLGYLRNQAQGFISLQPAALPFQAYSSQGFPKSRRTYLYKPWRGTSERNTRLS